MFQTLDSEKLSKPLKPNLKKTLSNQMRLNRKVTLIVDDFLI